MPDVAYADFAQRVLDDGWLPDPWLDGAPRLDPQPVVLSPERAERLCAAAEGVALACDALCQLLTTEPQLLEPLGLQPVQAALWWSSAPAWHCLARADVFETDDGGIQVCEINCDTPSGIAEAVVLGRLLDSLDGTDANRTFPARWVAMLRRIARSIGKDPIALTCGLISPTEQTEDLPMLLLWRHWLEQAGWRVVEGSPFNLQAHPDGRAALLGVPCDVVVRHYKTDWWAERQTVWLDEQPVLDAEPLRGPLQILLSAQLAGATAVVNPMGAIVPQNKRFLALLWQHRARLGAVAQSAIEAFVPRTHLLEELPVEQLHAEQALWVLKSDYGCEGDEVVVGAEVPPEVWANAVRQAIPGRWIAQRYFSATRDENGAQLNIGVYLIGGDSAGLLARRSVAATDRRARMATVRVSAPPADNERAQQSGGAHHG